MNSFPEFLKTLLLRAPREIIVALIRAILILILIIPILLLKLIECLKRLLETKTLFEEETEDDCGDLPEPIVRRPDPCIYSQQYLRSQGLPVTWNNPDIWAAPASDPAAVEPDSYHLKDDTDYIVTVQAHNASTDAAIGVAVRLVYRPWSFNSPDLIPVETNAGGNEVINHVDIAPMGAKTTEFRWHTPKLDPGTQKHYCLQAILEHPLDLNVANNMGQENTNVYSQNPGHVQPGEIAKIDVPLFNREERPIRAKIHWDAYEIDLEEEHTLRLKKSQGRTRQGPAEKLAALLPSVSSSLASDTTKAGAETPRLATFGKIQLGTFRSNYLIEKTKYVGFDALREKLLKGDYSLPPGLDVQLPDGLENGIDLDANETKTLTVTIKIPDDAQPGARMTVNLIAEKENGAPLGGVTLYFRVKE